MKRHDPDLASLASGAIFVTVGLLLGLDYSISPRWVMPLVLIGIGLAGLLSTVTAARRESGPAAYDVDDEPA